MPRHQRMYCTNIERLTDFLNLPVDSTITSVQWEPSSGELQLYVQNPTFSPLQPGEPTPYVLAAAYTVTFDPDAELAPPPPPIEWYGPTKTMHDVEAERESTR